MNNRRLPFVFLMSWLFFLPILLFAQAEFQLFTSQPDVSNFPEVSFRVRSADANGVPLTSYDGLSVRENGVPISNYSLTSVPVGIDLIFVLDANETILFVDQVSGLSQYDKVQASLSTFADRFMSPGNRDRVSFIVPDAAGENGRLLLDDVSDPAVLTAGLASYTPTPSDSVPLNQMMTQAFEVAESKAGDSRFQAVVLLTDATRLPQTVDIQTAVSQAQAQQIPIFVMILGGDASSDEISNARQLTQPTRGDYVALRGVDDANSLYLIWQRQANQIEVRYTSLQRENGRYPITLNLGQANAATEFELNLQPPRLTLQLERDVIRRVGTAVDTPIGNLVPAVQPINVQVSWPDEVPRQLAEVTLLVNGQTAVLTEPPTLSDPTQLTLFWDISNQQDGTFELSVTVTDRLGRTATTDTRLVTVIHERPLPPTATPRPTPTPIPAPLPQRITSQIEPLGWRAGGLVLVVGLLMLPIWRWLTRRRRATTPALPPVPPPAAPPPPPATQAAAGQTAVLLSATLSQTKIPLQADSITIGRDAKSVSLPLVDRTVSLLHARIRRQNGRFWLYDEGSSNGTFLNHTRLGLSPQPLTEGDEIQIGRFRFTFAFVDLTELETEEE